MKFHVVVLQRTTRSYSKVRAARAVRLFFTTQSIKFLICDVVIPFAVVGAKAPYQGG